MIPLSDKDAEDLRNINDEDARRRNSILGISSSKQTQGPFPKPGPFKIVQGRSGDYYLLSYNNKGKIVSKPLDFGDPKRTPKTDSPLYATSQLRRMMKELPFGAVRPTSSSVGRKGTDPVYYTRIQDKKGNWTNVPVYHNTLSEAEEESLKMAERKYKAVNSLKFNEYGDAYVNGRYAPELTNTLKSIIKGKLPLPAGGLPTGGTFTKPPMVPGTGQNRSLPTGVIGYDSTGRPILSRTNPPTVGTPENPFIVDNVRVTGSLLKTYITSLGKAQGVNVETLSPGGKLITGEELYSKLFPQQSGTSRQITFHSGGAGGADTEWANAGSKTGIKTIGYSFEGHSNGFTGKRPEFETRSILTREELLKHTQLVNEAGKVLGKRAGVDSPAGKLVHRNAYQVVNSQAILAVTNGFSPIADGSRMTVGGTGTPWAIEMGIILKKPIYVFDQNSSQWFEYNFEGKKFTPTTLDKIPTSYDNIATVGSRDIKPNGKQAITDYVNQISKTAVPLAQIDNEPKPSSKVTSGKLYNLRNLVRDIPENEMITERNLPKNSVYIGREIYNDKFGLAGTQWGNPFRVWNRKDKIELKNQIKAQSLKEGGRAGQWTPTKQKMFDEAVDKNIQDSLTKYEAWARERLKANPKWLEPLVNKNLVDWCQPGKCHGDVLTKLIGEKYGFKTAPGLKELRQEFEQLKKDKQRYGEGRMPQKDQARFNYLKNYLLSLEAKETPETSLRPTPQIEGRLLQEDLNPEDPNASAKDRAPIGKGDIQSKYPPRSDSPRFNIQAVANTDGAPGVYIDGEYDGKLTYALVSTMTNIKKSPKTWQRIKQQGGAKIGGVFVSISQMEQFSKSIPANMEVIYDKDGQVTMKPRTTGGSAFRTLGATTNALGILVSIGDIIRLAQEWSRPKQVPVK